MKEYCIGVLGALINNSNLGCVALTYSLIQFMQTLETELLCKFKFIVFETWGSESKIKQFAENLGLQEGTIESCNTAGIMRLHRKSTINQYKEKLSMCDFVIALTQGDSFSDIYGIRHFLRSWTEMAYAVNAQVPLILGPQTYGPYRNPMSRVLAKKIINKADLVISRDSISKEYLAKIGIKRDVYAGTDLAFGLDYCNDDVTVERPCVGVNVSGLLWPEKTESTPTKFKLKADYKKIIVHLLNRLQEKEVNVYLIPHVREDALVNEVLHTLYPFTKKVEPFQTPMEAKAFISSMDLFFGSRMHATIAAFSASVPVIPIAYSRKFEGLYSDFGYRNIIDLEEVTTQEAFCLIDGFVSNLPEVQRSLTRAHAVMEETYSSMRSIIKKEILTLIEPSKK